VFEGVFENDQKHGPGKLVTMSGVVLHGEWVNDVHQIPRDEKDEGNEPTIREDSLPTTNRDDEISTDITLPSTESPLIETVEQVLAATRVVYPNGDVYEGEMLDGMRHDECGKLTYASGAVYTGGFVKDKKHGRGHSVNADGSEYEGEYTNNEANGMGTFRADGESYTGQWVGNEQCGHGRYVYSNGDVYDGEWRSSLQWGHGTMTFADGSTYVGDYEEDNAQGTGTFTDAATGDVYSGQWYDGVREGKGMLKYGNGDVFEGVFENDQKHGPGKFIPKKGVTLTGEWVNDIHYADKETVVVSPCVSPDNSRESKSTPPAPRSSSSSNLEPMIDDIYDGEFVNGKKEGHGKLTTSDGNVYEGNFVNDMKHGSGVLLYSSGAKYDGNFR
jgi:hypothetical protein